MRSSNAYENQDRLKKLWLEKKGNVLGTKQSKTNKQTSKKPTKKNLTNQPTKNRKKNE